MAARKGAAPAPTGKSNAPKRTVSGIQRTGVKVPPAAAASEPPREVRSLPAATREAHEARETRETREMRSPSTPPGAGVPVPAPADLSAHTFVAGGQEFVVLSYSVSANELPPGLTDAERAVVAAVLDGRSNAAIATMRGTSPRTIANQVAAVFRKLGVRSRTELATKVLRVEGATRGRSG